MFRRAATSAATRKVSYFLAPAPAPARKARSTFISVSRHYRDRSLWTTVTTAVPAPGDALRSRLQASSAKPVFFLCRSVRDCFVLTPISLEDDGSFSSKFSIRIIFPQIIPFEFGKFYSCNGLFCYPIPDVENVDQLYVWNPATLESRKLPDSPHNKAKCDDSLEKANTFVATWADPDPESEDYKVLRFFCYRLESDPVVGVGPTEVELYSVKTNSWKKIIFSESLAGFGIRMPRCCINGVFYTAVALENRRRAMISFDFRSETFSAALPLPEFAAQESYKLLELDGQPSLVTCRRERSPGRNGMIIFQWVLRNGEWVMVAQYDSCSEDLKPLAFARNGELLLFQAYHNRPYSHYQLMVFDTTTQELKQIPGFASNFRYDHFVFAKTFLKLKPSSGEQEKEESQFSYLGDFKFLNYVDCVDIDDYQHRQSTHDQHRLD